ncbi:MAG: SIR2 family protein [Coriobacteriia bacterium]|nr:SIR2 family protein [Coriobacteriia bacterium]
MPNDQPTHLVTNVIDIVKGDDGRFSIDNDNHRSFVSDAFSCSHINFLLGAGFSAGSVQCLGDREKWSEAINACNEHWFDGKRQIAEALLNYEFFCNVLIPMRNVEPSDSQKRLCREVKRIVQSRGTTTIPKRACVFTTNYDPLIELALEAENCIFNDGFEGRNQPRFATRSFSRLQYVQSLSMEYASQIPTINVAKLHGSLTWRSDDGQTDDIYYCDYKKGLDALAEEYKVLLENQTVCKTFEVIGGEPSEASLESLAKALGSIDEIACDKLLSFSKAYYLGFRLVNPAKQKFADTVLGLTYYELLRLYANELDRNNALLVAFGFSFADEHILEITKRALENPQLMLWVCCHTEDNLDAYQSLFSSVSNVWFFKAEEKLDLEVFCDVLGMVGK